MKKTIYNKFDKAKIAALPQALFPGRIEVVLSAKQAEKAVNYLLAQDVMGVDTETRPSFKRGDIHKVSLLQVSTRDICFLFRLNHTGLTPDVVRLLEDTVVPKIGLSLTDDMHALHKLGDFTPGLFIDLQDHVREIGVEDLSLPTSSDARSASDSSSATGSATSSMTSRRAMPLPMPGRASCSMMSCSA